MKLNKYYLYSRPKGLNIPYSTLELVATKASIILAHITKYRSKPGHIGKSKEYKIIKRGQHA